MSANVVKAIVYIPRHSWPILQRMQKLAGQRFEVWAGEVLESTAIEFANLPEPPPNVIDTRLTVNERAELVAVKHLPRTDHRTRITAEDREMILKLSAEGWRSSEIAHRLRISPKTVRVYRALK